MNNVSAFRSPTGSTPLLIAVGLCAGLFLLDGQRMNAQLYPAKPDTSCARIIRVFRTTPASDAARTRMIACTDSVDSAFRQDRLDRMKAEAMRLAMMFFDVPEYHDEGRLPAGRDAVGPVLGPLAGIYASPFLHGFTRPAQIYEQGQYGTLAGIVVVQRQNEETMPATYARLSLHFGMNCIWLHVDPPEGNVANTTYLTNLHYRAFVSGPTGETPKCDRTAPMSAELAVIAVRSDQFPVDSAYLPAARFDTDMSGNIVLGFRCLNAFCEIGVDRPAAVRMPFGLHRVTPAGDKFEVRSNQPVAEPRGKRLVIKAWHDEQTLAIRDSGFVWRPSSVRAIITPELAAATLDSVHFTNVWVRVATIRIEGTIPDTSKYYRWGFRSGSNYLEFQYADTATSKKWRARIMRPDSTYQVWRYMERTLHYDVTVPPIVRFRWTGIDDGVWAPCGQACCKAADGS